MQLQDFDYELPEELIAQKPIEPRNSSRLMVLNPRTKSIEHRKFFELEDFLRRGDTLIFNDTSCEILKHYFQKIEIRKLY